MEKKQKKQKIWKIVHVISYVLSALFIIVCIGVGCYSCSNNQSQNKPVNNVVEVYKPAQYYNVSGNALTLASSEFFNAGIISIMYNYCADNSYTLLNSQYYDLGSSSCYNIDYVTTYNYSHTYVSVYEFPTVTYYTVNLSNNSSPINQSNNDISIVLTSDSDTTNGVKIYRSGWNKTLIKRVVINNCPSNLITLITDYVNNDFNVNGGGYTEEDLQTAYQGGYQAGYTAGNTAGYESGYNTGYEVGYRAGHNAYEEETDHILLAQTYDFRQWIGNVDETSGCIRYTMNDDSKYFIYKGLTFRANGNEYNAIRMLIVKVQRENGIATAKDNVSGKYLGYNGYYLFGNDYNKYVMLMQVDYCKYDNNDNIVLYNRVYEMPYVSNVDMTYKDYSNNDQISTYNSTAYQPNNCYVDLAYRDIIIIQNDDTLISTPAFNDTTVYTLLTMQLSQTSIAVFSDTGVFSLLRGGFDALGGIFSIQILPNITVGLLLFMPLVVSIIVAVIYIIKK